MINKIKLFYKKIYQKINYETQKLLVLNGKLLSELNSRKNISTLDEVEFQVFSQRGEDGVIQYLINQIDIPNKIFVEFGVETYTESNTRFLLINNNWSGLIIDGSKDNINFIKSDYIYWKYDITAVESFITRNNINKIMCFASQPCAYLTPSVILLFTLLLPDCVRIFIVLKYYSLWCEDRIVFHPILRPCVFL